MEPIAVFQGSATLFNAIDLMRKRSGQNVEMRLYPDSIELSDAGPGTLLFRSVFPRQVMPRDQVSEIYPILIQGRLIGLHPLVRGRGHIWIAMKSRGRYDGTDKYWFAFDHPGTGELLDVFESAGYPVDRQPRRANLVSGEDTKIQNHTD